MTNLDKKMLAGEKKLNELLKTYLIDNPIDKIGKRIRELYEKINNAPTSNEAAMLKRAVELQTLLSTAQDTLESQLDQFTVCIKTLSREVSRRSNSDSKKSK